MIAEVMWKQSMIQQKFIGIATIVIALAGTILLITHNRSHIAVPGSQIVSVTSNPLIESTPSPAWYEAHRDILKADNSRCDADGKNMPQHLCANVGIANKEISSQDAINALNQAGSSEK
jgi:hypothetical protein